MTPYRNTSFTGCVHEIFAEVEFTGLFCATFELSKISAMTFLKKTIKNRRNNRKIYVFDFFLLSLAPAMNFHLKPKLMKVPVCIHDQSLFCFYLKDMPSPVIYHRILKVTGPRKEGLPKVTLILGLF